MVPVRPLPSHLYALDDGLLSHYRKHHVRLSWSRHLLSPVVLKAPPDEQAAKHAPEFGITGLIGELYAANVDEVFDELWREAAAQSFKECLTF
jgi:hypothetical protein